MAESAWAGSRSANSLVYRSLQEISTSSNTNGMNFLIAAILRQMNLLIPRGNDKILPGDRVYVVLDQGDNREITYLHGHIPQAHAEYHDLRRKHRAEMLASAPLSAGT